MKRKETSEAGFSLIEAIIAFIILSITIGLAVQSISLGASSVARAERQDATLKALREILATDQGMLATTVRDGTLENNMRWILKRQRIAGLDDTEITVVTVEFFQQGKTVPFDRFVSFRPIMENR